MEIVVFAAAVFVVAVLVMWRSRRGGTAEIAPIALADGDRPEPGVSNESAIGPHRNVGRPWRVDRGDGPPDAGGRAS